MILLPIGFKDTKFNYDVDVLMPIVKSKIDTKIFVDAQSTIGTAPNNPPILIINWFHFTKYEGKIIIEYEANDNYLCADLTNYANATNEWDTLIKNSYNKLRDLYSQKISALRLGNTDPDFGISKGHILRESIIKGLNQQI